MGVPDHLARGALRVTLGRWNTRDDVEAFVDVLESLVRDERRRAARPDDASQS